jgi:hypothetical protein
MVVVSIVAVLIMEMQVIVMDTTVVAIMAAVYMFPYGYRVIGCMITMVMPIQWVNGYYR